MQLFKTPTKFDFMAKRKLAMVISASVVLLLLVTLVIRGLSLGIDFTGGTLVEVGYQEPVELSGIRETLSDAGFKDALVQHFGTSRDVLVRLAPRSGEDSAELSTRAFEALNADAGGAADLRRVEFI